MLLFTLLQAACSKRSSEDNAVGPYGSIVPEQQWVKPASALDVSMLHSLYQEMLFWVRLS